MSKRNLQRAYRNYVEGPPDLAIEIVSPESAERDYVSKRGLYEKHGVREYWIVDEGLKKVMPLRLDATGHYREAQPRNSVVRSRVIAGFWLKEEWLWQQPRPAVLSTVKKLLRKSYTARGPV